MDSLRALLGEIHRRSLWQVLGIYLATSWGVLNAVDVLTGFAGLPDWTPTMALVLLLIGLPIVMATAVLQQGFPGRSVSDEVEPDAPPADEVSTGTLGTTIFTWRNAIGGGALAGVLLVVATGVYLFMWSTGIGSVGSLVAQGVLDARDPVMLAEFGNRTADETLGAVVTEALSVDLGSSEAVTLLGRDAVRSTLGMMGRDPDLTVTDEVAREVAVRMNVKAFVAGEVSRVGTRYLLVARIVSPSSGEDLVSFREEASGDDDLLPAIDRLSQRLREKMGESLRSIRLGAPLEQATTSSLDALRKLTQAEQAEEAGDYEGALRLLDAAVALDTAFAMGYRKISVIHSNMGSQELTNAAATLAFQHRDRLTERERYLTEANYYGNVLGDVDATIAAYEAVLEIAPDESVALNNLSNRFRSRAEFERAHELLSRAVSGPGASSVAHLNFTRVLFSLGDIERGLAAREVYRERYPEHHTQPWAEIYTAAVSGDRETVHRVAESMRGTELFYFSDDLERFELGAYAYDGRITLALERATAQPYIGNQFVYLGMVPHSTGEAAVRLWLLDDSVGAADALARALPTRFDAIPAGERIWAAPIGTFANAGDAARARVLFGRWQSEVDESLIDAGSMALARAAIEHAEGELEAALASVERAADAFRCDRCVEQQRAYIFESLGRVGEAIEIWQRVRDLPMEVESAGWERIVAMKRLGPLHERAGDAQAAIEAYRAFADAWADGDAIVQPQVDHARSRIAALSGAAPA